MDKKKCKMTMYIYKKITDAFSVSKFGLFCKLKPKAVKPRSYFFGKCFLQPCEKDLMCSFYSKTVLTIMLKRNIFNVGNIIPFSPFNHL